ncbi:adenosylcobinamide-GDP ribazoletransferase [Nocardioides marmorisolisilvae]|uniref:Adenosylcobinamide-GDP ribazoletransferase n=1 Tax=Nocardioides marmorisolisilvae TaxID=1542737 RepID=A0A3N0DW11_9ACTN|nr:adenosylcobinamide-GDP ribazoletransferase [Nocardioides marmorisolisilvae]RNL79797.1 adenosylcobinamide-GDP ribazoletransferase [Nocardioides marmorisolisilvae]
MTALAKAGRAGVAALSFLTVLPVGRLVALDGEDVARGSVLFPVVGALIGALTGGIAWGIGDDLPPMLAAALAVAAGAMVTGALHLDGLADCADGFGARTPEDRLRVMRDHTNGTYGGTALLLDLIIRVSALAALAGTRDALLFSVAAGALSRTVGPLLAIALPYAQAKPGAGEALNSFPSQPRAAAVLVISGLVTFFCVDDSTAYPLCLVATAVVIALVGWTAKKRLGRVTGDVMGACSELVELAVLTVLVATL